MRQVSEKLEQCWETLAEESLNRAGRGGGVEEKW